MHRPLLLLVALASLAGCARHAAPGAAGVSAPEPGRAGGGSGEASAARLAARWSSQMFGFDALEAYESRRGGARGELVIARKWYGDTARIAFDVVSPPQLARVAALLIQQRGGGDELFLYAPLPSAPRRSGMAVSRALAPPLEFPMPGTDAAVPVPEVRPFLEGELSYARLPDEVIAGEPCDVVEGRRTGAHRGFDRIELAIARRLGVALRTRYFWRDLERRRVTVRPEDVERFDGRWLPTRRVVEDLETSQTSELILRNIVIDAQLPDRLFRQHNLRFQRFPSF